MTFPLRRNLALLLGLGFALSGACPILRAASPPLMTGDPGTPGAGHWEINLGVSGERRSGAKLWECPMLDFNYGIGDTVQLKYEVPYLVQDEAGQSRRSGWGNSEAGVKWRFHDTASQGGWAASVYPQLEFNNAGSSSDDRGLVESGSTFLLPVQVEKQLGGVKLNLELGREFRASEDAWFYGAAVSRPLNARVELGVELTGAATAGLDRSRLAVNGGLTFAVDESSSLHVAVGRELHNHSEPVATLLGYIGWQWRR
jgi:hypothetical protein